MYSKRINDMLDQLKKIRQSNNAALEAQHSVKIVQLMEVDRENEMPNDAPVKGTSSNFGPGIWNKKLSKYDASCSYPLCGEFIEAGTLCWVTVGESPRCVKHGNPNLDKPADKPATDMLICPACGNPMKPNEAA